MININMLTYATGKEASTPVYFDRENFWNVYLDALAIKNNIHLAERTKNFFVEVLKHPAGTNFFSGENREAIAKKLNLHNTQFTHFSKELVGCGYMEKVSRGVVLPKSSFVSIQTLIDKGNFSINLMLPIIVTDNV